MYENRILTCSVIVFLLILQGITLPKVQPKFENFVKHGYRVSDAKVQHKVRVLASVYQISKLFIAYK